MIGVPNPLAGRNIKAFIVLKDEFEGKRKEEERARLEKLKKTMRVSRTLKVAQIALILEMPEADLYPRLVD